MSSEATAWAFPHLVKAAHWASYLLRGFNSKKEPITEISSEEALTALGFNKEKFVDMCILLGSDYTEHIDGIGPATGFNLINTHGNIENVIEFINRTNKYKIPENFNYVAARELFHYPEVNTEVQFTWGTVDEPGLIKFLVDDKGFNPERVNTAIGKLKKLHGKPAQLVLENFFGKATITKRKPVEQKSGKKIKKK